MQAGREFRAAFFFAMLPLPAATVSAASWSGPCPGGETVHCPIGCLGALERCE